MLSRLTDVFPDQPVLSCDDQINKSMVDRLVSLNLVCAGIAMQMSHRMCL